MPEGVVVVLGQNIATCIEPPLAMRVVVATKAASVRTGAPPGHERRANFRDVFSVSATGHTGRARPTAGSYRGFARYNLFR